jgi:hypothetical protein
LMAHQALPASMSNTASDRDHVAVRRPGMATFGLLNFAQPGSTDPGIGHSDRAGIGPGVHRGDRAVGKAGQPARIRQEERILSGLPRAGAPGSARPTMFTTPTILSRRADNAVAARRGRRRRPAGRRPARRVSSVTAHPRSDLLGGRRRPVDGAGRPTLHHRLHRQPRLPSSPPCATCAARASFTTRQVAVVVVPWALGRAAATRRPDRWESPRARADFGHASRCSRRRSPAAIDAPRRR